jgi:hypothetical protein
LGTATARQRRAEWLNPVGIWHDRQSVTIDWTLRENARAQIRVLVRRILRKYGYPPDKQEKATQTVLEQAELLGAEWAEQVVWNLITPVAGDNFHGVHAGSPHKDAMAEWFFLTYLLQNSNSAFGPGVIWHRLYGGGNWVWPPN